MVRILLTLGTSGAIDQWFPAGNNEEVEMNGDDGERENEGWPEEGLMRKKLLWNKYLKQKIPSKVCKFEPASAIFVCVIFIERFISFLWRDLANVFRNVILMGGQ